MIYQQNQHGLHLYAHRASYKIKNYLNRFQESLTCFVKESKTKMLKSIFLYA